MNLFISHASEDKNSCAKPLAEMLQCSGIEVWLDQYEMRLGDRIRSNIDLALSKCDYGVVIISNNFFRKPWALAEIEALFARESLGKKVILPVWHGISIGEVCSHSPLLAGKIGISTDAGLPAVCEAIISAITPISDAHHNLPLVAERLMQQAIRHNDYYVYISRTKLSVLNQTVATDNNVFQLLNNFRHSLDRMTIDEHGYIQSEMKLRWGIVDFGVMDADYRIVFFYSKEHNLLLTGSPEHIVNSFVAKYKYPPSHFGYSGSHLPSVIQFLHHQDYEKKSYAAYRRPRMRHNESDEHIETLIEKHTIHFPEQEMSFVAKVLGVVGNLQIASPIYVSLSPTNVKSLQHDITINHEAVDPVEIENRRKEFEAETKLKLANERLDVLIAAPSLPAFEEALSIYSSNSRDYSIRSRDFSIFLRDVDVLRYCSDHLRDIPLSWKIVAAKAREIKDTETEQIVLKTVLRENNVGENIDAFLHVAKHELRGLREVAIEKLGNADHNIRMWAAYALGEIGLPADIETLLNLHQNDSSYYVREKAGQSITKLTKSLML